MKVAWVLKNIVILNQSLLLKRCWEVANGASPSASFLKGRFVDPGLTPTVVYRKSSIWTGLKKLWPTLTENVHWLIGNGLKTSFWKDNWVGQPLFQLCNIDVSLLPHLNASVKDYIVDHRWVLPPLFSQLFPSVADCIHEIVLPLENTEDQVIWSGSSSGKLSAHDAYDFLLPHHPMVNWGKRIWHPAIQPRKSLLTWKVLHEKVPIDALLQRRGHSLFSMCSFCNSSPETLDHLFLQCRVVLQIWDWMLHLFHLRSPTPLSIHALISVDLTTSIQRSGVTLWKLVCCNLLWSIWRERNKVRFDTTRFCAIHLKRSFILSLRDSASLSFKPCTTYTSSLPIFSFLSLSALNIRAPRFVPVTWVCPPPPWLKANTDGSFHDVNFAGYGGIFRDNLGLFQGAFSAKVSVPCAIDAEVLAVIEALRLAWVRNWTHIWIETDSSLVVTYFRHPHMVPWCLRAQWLNCLHFTRQINFRVSHIFREGNAVADRLARYGASIDGYMWWNSLPPFISDHYGRDLSSLVSYRFR